MTRTTFLFFYGNNSNSPGQKMLMMKRMNAQQLPITGGSMHPFLPILVLLLCWEKATLEEL